MSQNSQNPIITQYLDAFQKQLKLFSTTQQLFNNDTNTTITNSNNGNDITSSSSSSSSSPTILAPSISLQPITFVTKPTPLGQPQPKNQAIINLSPTEKAIFTTVRKIVNYYNLKCNPRVAGGWVRDKLLHKESHDIDIALEGMEGEDFAQYIKLYSQTVDDAESFPTGKKISSISVIKSNPTQSKHLNTATFVLHGLPIDVSNLRTEVYAIDSRIPMMQMGSVRDDVIRRDFTCNALFYNIMTEEIEDICGRSKYDLDNKIISTPLHSFKTFNDDPLRVLRCVRFASRLRFTIDSPIYYAASHLSTHLNLVKKVSRERYGIELKKMFESFTTTQFSLSLLCQWKLRPLIFMLPIGQYKDFKPPPPLVKGKQKQDEIKLLLQKLEHLDNNVQSQVTINPVASLRFPIYSIYDLAPRTIFQALYPQEFSHLLQSMHEMLLPPPPCHPDDIDINDNNNNNNSDNTNNHNEMKLKVEKFSFEFAPYAQNDELITSIHSLQHEKYYEPLISHYNKNKYQLRDYFFRGLDPYDVEFISNSHPYIRKHCHNDNNNNNNHKNVPLSINGNHIQREMRERPIFPPPLNFFSLFEDRCLTSLCSQSLSSFRILCEKVYKNYFCAPSLPGVTLFDSTPSSHHHQQQQQQQHSNPTTNQKQNSFISSFDTITMCDDDDDNNNNNSNLGENEIINTVYSVPIPDHEYTRLAAIYSTNDSTPQSDDLCIRVHKASKPFGIKNKTINIKLTQYHEIYQTLFDTMSSSLLQQSSSTITLTDQLYDQLHLYSQSQIEMHNAAMELLTNPQISSSSTTTTSSSSQLPPLQAIPPVYNNNTPNTLPTMVLVYKRENKCDDLSLLNNNINNNNSNVNFSQRDDCTSVSGAYSDSYRYVQPNTDGNQYIQLDDTLPPNYTIVPINPAIFVNKFDTTDTFGHITPPLSPQQQEERDQQCNQYAVQRALLSIFPSNSTNSPLSIHFHQMTLANPPAQSLVSTYSHLEQLRLASILPIETPDNTLLSPLSPLSPFPMNNDPNNNDNNNNEEQQLIDTEPILTQRIQTPYTPSNDVFRIALYASFLWPYYGFNMITAKGKQKSLLYHFLVDSLKLSTTEGEIIEIMIESALTMIQLSYQWVDIVAMITKQVDNNTSIFAADIADDFTAGLGLNLIDTTSIDYQPITSIHLAKIDAILAQRITSVQAQIGTIINKTCLTLAPGTSSTATMSPMLYNSTLELIILLAFNIQTIMNMPLYKLPQPQNNVTIKSTLDWKHTNDDDIIPEEESDHDEIYDQDIAKTILEQGNEHQTTPTINISRATSNIATSLSPIMTDKAQRQTSRTARLMSMLQNHPLVVVADQNNIDNNDNHNNNNNDDDNNNQIIINNNNNNNINSTNMISTIKMCDHDDHQIGSTTKKMRSNEVNNTERDDQVQLLPANTTSLSAQKLKKSSSVLSQNHHHHHHHHDNNEGQLIAVYEPLSTIPNDEVPLKLLPQPMKEHFFASQTTPNVAHINNNHNHNNNNTISHTNNNNHGSTVYNFGSLDDRFNSNVVVSTPTKTPNTTNNTTASNTPITSNLLLTSNQQPPQQSPQTLISTHSSLTGNTNISATSSSLSTIQLHQAQLLERNQKMSQYVSLIPAQPRHTPYIHDEIPSMYSLFTFPGISTQLQFETCDQMNQDDNDDDDNKFITNYKSRTPLSPLPSSPFKPNNTSVDATNSEYNAKLAQYELDMHKYQRLKQTTPSISVDRKMNMDSLPIVTYTPHHVLLTQHGLNTIYSHHMNNNNWQWEAETMNEAVHALVQVLSSQQNIDLVNHDDIDISTYTYYNISKEKLAAHITQQKTSLLIIHALSRGYLRFRTTPIAHLARNSIYSNLNTPFSVQYLHALKKPLLLGSDAVRLTKKYKELYTAQQQQQSSPDKSTTIFTPPPIKPYLPVQGPILGKVMEHLFELKYWYPYIERHDILTFVEKMSRFEIIPSNLTISNEIHQQLFQPGKKK